jgi:hypothetical protein
MSDINVKVSVSRAASGCLQLSIARTSPFNLFHAVIPSASASTAPASWPTSWRSCGTRTAATGAGKHQQPTQHSWSRPPGTATSRKRASF